MAYTFCVDSAGRCFEAGDESFAADEDDGDEDSLDPNLN
jgi:hypothetical protein